MPTTTATTTPTKGGRKPQKLMTPGDFAAYQNAAIGSVYAWMRQGRISPGYITGKGISLFDEQEAERFRREREREREAKG
jgi:hypothetical protein